jgi:hypothetical protein
VKRGLFGQAAMKSADTRSEQFIGPANPNNTCGFVKPPSRRFFSVSPGGFSAQRGGRTAGALKTAVQFASEAAACETT